GLLVEGSLANSSPPAIAPDGAGGVIVGYVLGDSPGANTGLPIVMRYTATGALAPNWPAEGVRGAGPSGPMHYGPVAADGWGGAYIGWVDYRSAPSYTPPVPDYYANIYCQHVTSDGAIAPGWPAEGFPVCTQPDVQWTLQMSEDAQGGVILAWDDYRNRSTNA